LAQDLGSSCGGCCPDCASRRMRPALRRAAPAGSVLKGNYGGFFHTEALPGALPPNQNTPQHPPYNLYPELLSGNSFTEPRAHNMYAWLYRIRPSVLHQARKQEPWVHATWVTPPFKPAAPVPWRFHAIPDVPAKTDFLDGVVTIAGHGGPDAGIGAAASVYSATESMCVKRRVFCNHDADVMLLPQEGVLSLKTEHGILEVVPSELVIVPRGVRFQVNLGSGSSTAAGYMCENFGAHFQLPELSFAGISSGLAHTRHFVAPSAVFEESDMQHEMVTKYMGALFKGPIPRSPFDVVAWYGNYTPVKYDMRLYNAINTVTFDHPDPSIGCVMSSPTASPGLANIDFVIFPPRWLCAEDTFRPPWFHRNAMSEFMGLIHGSYDAKPGGFKPGASSLHNKYVPHGPDGTAVEAGTKMDTSKPERYCDTLAFMWESTKTWVPTEHAMAQLADRDYIKCWDNVVARFDPNSLPPSPAPLPFQPSGKGRK